MGKTESGAVWLDKKLLSPYDYWQFWRNIDNRDVIKFLKIFTDLEIEKIEKIKENNINELKILLANKATEMLHGFSESKKAEDTAKKTFTNNSTGEGLPIIKIGEKNFKNQITILDLIILSKLEKSKSEARRLVKGMAVKIDNKIVSNEKLVIDKKIFENNQIKLSLGKKRHIKIELS